MTQNNHSVKSSINDLLKDTKSYHESSTINSVPIVGELRKSDDPKYCVLIVQTRTQRTIELEISQIQDSELLQEVNGTKLVRVYVSPTMSIREILPSVSSLYQNLNSQQALSSFTNSAKISNIQMNKPFVLATPHLAPNWEEIEASLKPISRGQ